MALDEFLFGKVALYFKKKKQAALNIENRTVHLSDIKDRLTIMARAVSGVPIDIYPAEREGGYKGNNFFLPLQFSMLPDASDNLDFYHFRIFYLCCQKKLNINLFGDEPATTETPNSSLTQYSDRVLSFIQQEYPLVYDHYEAMVAKLASSDPKIAIDYSWFYGKLMRDTLPNTTIAPLSDFSDEMKKGNQLNPTTTIKAKPVEEIISTTVDKKQQEDFVLNHYFEKVETAEEFSGSWRDFDGDDELKKHENALDEMNMKFTVRVDDTTHSVYQADFIENTTVAESSEAVTTNYFITYDEWDYSKRQYKPGFCKVYPKGQQEIDVAYYKNTIAEHHVVLNLLRKMLTSVNNKMQQQHRQNQGSEFDLDSVVDLYADIHSGHTPSENIYINSRKKNKDFSILLLLDISLSSDGYADGNRIIDVEKQVAILFGEILNEFEIDFSIQCFNSKTRNQTNHITVKGFDEKWDNAKYKIGAVEPSGYTRIGTALRHSGALINQRDAKRKWILLLSDGKPNDYDMYEGKYGMYDIKQTLRELNQNQINTYALAIEANAKYYLPQMFGQTNYQILSKPVELLTSLVKLYEKIKHC